MGVLSLGYLRLEAADIEGWRVFAGDFLGMMPVDGNDPQSLYYRIDQYAARLVISPGAEAKATAIGYEVVNARVLDELVAAVEHAGIKVTAGSEEEAADRRVKAFVKFDDPGGNPIELFHSPVYDHVRVQTPLVSSFVTGDQGFGHVIVTAEDAQATVDFYIDVLGFVVRNTMNATTFMGCNARHHTFGVTPRPGPGQLLHLMVEAASLDDVGYALDRLDALEIPLMNSLGKHTNDHMVSFYCWSPENYAIEFGWGGMRIEEEEHTYEITKGAYWGHKFSPPPARG